MPIGYKGALGALNRSRAGIGRGFRDRVEARKDLLGISAMEPLELGIEAQVLSHAEAVPEDVVLGAKPKGPPDALHVILDRVPVDGAVPSGGRHDPGHHVDGRRLASPVVPQHDADLALVH